MIQQTTLSPPIRKRAQESSNAIARMYISMRHLLNRGFYKPMGVSGASLRNALLTLKPEIYGSIAETKSELNGLLYVIDRLPEGIAECVSVNLTAEEGLSSSSFQPIIPAKRRRNCYRIDKDQMVIEVTRGRSEVYDILTHLTFLYIEADKICDRVYIPSSNQTTREWQKIEVTATATKTIKKKELESTMAYLAQLLECTYNEAIEFYNRFKTSKSPHRFIQLIYHMVRVAVQERCNGEKRSVTFSAMLGDQIGHHVHGERWAKQLFQVLERHNLGNRPIHLISANCHSFLNSLYAEEALGDLAKDLTFFGQFTGDENNQQKVQRFATKHGFIGVSDNSGSNVHAQIIDTDKINSKKYAFPKGTILLVFDYAFGEQAYELMDELLKTNIGKQLESISVMGKAGIMKGKKGDIMVPTAHIFEGTSDNYPFHNDLSLKDFSNTKIPTLEGTMITVLGTSLQNKDILTYFCRSSWKVIGIEMEGVHYQKAIQSAMHIRKTVRPTIKLRYAYYASDNPLETGSTLASGSLGQVGVVPTYTITQKILEKNKHGINAKTTL